MAYELLNKGTYRAIARVVETEDGPTYAQVGSSEKKGTLFVLVNFELLEGPDAGRKAIWRGYFPKDSPKVEKRTIESLKYAGFKGDDLTTVTFQELTQEVELVIDHEADDRGGMRDRVAWVNRPGGGGGVKLQARLPKDELKRFAAEMRAKVKAVGDVATPAPAANGAPAAPVEDDLAF